ncbi:hypothetical protein QC281_02040 [Streptomyces sp. DH17]|nr:hypothetical protein [Streptomyces sp. DH17]
MREAAAEPPYHHRTRAGAPARLATHRTRASDVPRLATHRPTDRKDPA